MNEPIATGGEAFDPAQAQSHPFCTQEQGLALMQAEVAAGRLTAEKASAMLREDFGVALPGHEEARAVAHPEDAESFQELPGFEPASAEAFKLPPLIGPGEDYTPEVAQFDRQVRSWMTAAELPAAIGSSLAQEAAKVDAQLRDASGEERAAYAAGQSAQLRRMWGNDYERRVELARQLVETIEKRSPGLVEYLENTGAGDSAMVITQLSMQAERLASRRRR